jgi:hypothetical protein
VVVAALALASRVGLLLLGELWLALPFTEQVPLGRYVEPGSGQLERLGMSDPVLYRSIMESGYERRPFTDDRQANWAFLPAWPLLWRAGDLLLPADVASVLLNVVLFTAGCALVFLLLRHYVGEQAAWIAAALLIVAPGAQFTLRPGPESLFLAASAGALLLAQRGRWWLVAPVVTVAALTRPQGVLLLVPLALMALQQVRRSGRFRDLLPTGAAMLAPMVAVVAFCAYLGRLTGNAFATFDIQRAWDNETTLPGVAVLRSARTLLLDQSATDYYGFNLIPLSLAVIALSLVLLAEGARRRRLPLALLAYTAVSLLLLLTRSQTQAALRYVLVLFPLYGIAAVALQGSRWLRILLLTLLAAQVAMYVSALQGIEWALT